MCNVRQTLAKVDVVRAWKDEEYRLSLSDAQRAVLPAAPAGLIELTDEELGGIAAARLSNCSCGTGCTCKTHHCARALGF